MHTKDARAEGETEQRLYGVSAWRETPFYTPRERAALEWAEKLADVDEFSSLTGVCGPQFLALTICRLPADKLPRCDGSACNTNHHNQQE